MAQNRRRQPSRKATHQPPGEPCAAQRRALSAQRSQGLGPGESAPGGLEVVARGSELWHQPDATVNMLAEQQAGGKDADHVAWVGR